MKINSQTINFKSLHDGHLAIVLLSLLKSSGNGMPKLNGRELALILETISQREISVGGPYRCLDTDKASDLELNTLIAVFLDYQKVSLPKLNHFIIKNLRANKIELKLFCRHEQLIFWLSKISHKNIRQALKEYLLKHQKITPDAKLQIFDRRDKVIIEHSLLNEEKIKQEIIKLIDQKFSNLPTETMAALKTVAKNTIKNNPDKQMWLLPYYFQRALGAEGKSIKPELILKLSLMNIFFWSAFIIYDDFWDEDEKAEPKLLPLANLMARHFSNFFNSFFEKKPGWENFFQDLMDKADSTNHLETTNGRFGPCSLKIPDKPNYQLKFFPAAGHILGSIAILAELGYKNNSAEIKNLITYFKGYLVARQLNDDLHDFDEDFKRGHLSLAVSEALRDYLDSKREEHLNKDLTPAEEFLKIKKLFWHKTLKRLSLKIIAYSRRAERNLNKIKILQNPEFLNCFCQQTEKAAHQALRERKRSLEFLRYFRNEGFH
jgi:hypothetical protein